MTYLDTNTLKAVKCITRWIRAVLTSQVHYCGSAWTRERMNPASYGNKDAGDLKSQVTCYRRDGHVGKHRNGKWEWTKG